MSALRPSDPIAADAATGARVRAIVEAHLPGYEPRTVDVLAADGADDGALLVEVDGNLVIEVGSSAEGIAAQRLSPEVEASLLRSLAGLLDVPLPIPVFADDAPPVRAYRKLPGQPLTAVPIPDLQQSRRLARRLGGMLADLHGVDASDTGVNLPIAGGPETYRASAARAWAAHESYWALQDIDPELRAGVEHFLQQPAPHHPPHPSLAHLGLRPASVLLAATDGELTGIQQWSSAAIGDPACDLGAVLLLLGRDALDAALDGYRRAGAVTDDDPDLMERIVFHARCAAIRDLPSSPALGMDPDPSVARLSSVW